MKDSSVVASVKRPIMFPSNANKASSFMSVSTLLHSYLAALYKFPKGAIPYFISLALLSTKQNYLSKKEKKKEKVEV